MLSLRTYSTENPQQLEEVLHRFNSLVLDGKIETEVIHGLELFEIKERDKLIAASEDQDILGLLHYSVSSPKDYHDLAGSLQNNLSFSITNYGGEFLFQDEIADALSEQFDSFSDNIAFLSQIEVFQKNNGIGSLLMDELKSENFDRIFLVSLQSAVGFYRTHGFYNTGLYTHSDLLRSTLPVLCWDKGAEISREEHIEEVGVYKNQNI